MKHKHIDLIHKDSIPEGQDIYLDDFSEIYCMASRLEKICEEKKLSGVSATQCGIPLNFFVLGGNPLNPIVYFNCNYLPVGDDTVLSIETCPTIMNEDGEQRFFEVKRFKKIKLLGKKIEVSEKNEKEPFRIVDVEDLLDGQKSCLFQRMIDYKFGKKNIIDQIGKEIFLL